MQLRVEDFAQIAEANIDFGESGDLTVLIGQQATGKSLVLQWLKLVTDSLVIRSDWEHYGTNWKQPSPQRALDLFFGEGMRCAYSGKTRVWLNGKRVELDNLFQKRRAKTQEAPVERTYYIPAHRALLMAEGWPKNFQQHGIDTPYVARAQSERLARWLGDIDTAVFPLARRLPQQVRDGFDRAIFHGSKLEVDRNAPQRRLVLRPRDSQEALIPFMAWTAGQREFVPLLLALYELMPAGGVPRLGKAGQTAIETVVLEEPELGLHPKALFSLGVTVLQLMARGYRVAVSSHSPLMVDFAWAINRFRAAKAAGAVRPADIRTAFDLRPGPDTTRVIDTVLTRQARTYYLSYGRDGRVRSKDISPLNAIADDDDQGSWGELLKYSQRLAEAIGSLDFDFSVMANHDITNE